MNHYEQLGVDPTATNAEIKKAYRAKARAKHPDKGGDAKEFAPVAQAYKVLSDPQSRLLYNTAGIDARPPIEIEARNALLGVINQALAQEGAVSIIESVRHTIQAAAAEVPGQIKQLKARRKKLQARRNGVTTTGDTNLVHMVIDGELKNIAANLAQAEHIMELHKVCLLELDKYKEDEQELPVHRHRGTYSVTFQSYG